MKKSLLLITICCLCLVSCGGKKETESNNDKAANPTSTESDFPDLNGEIIWQQEDKTIQNILGEYPRVLFTGYYVSSTKKISSSLLRHKGNRLLVSGKITMLYDLDKDGIPEFMLNGIHNSDDGIKGNQYLLSLSKSYIIN